MNNYNPYENCNNNTGLGQYQDSVGLPANWAQQPIIYQNGYDVTQQMFQYHFKQQEDLAKAVALKQQEHQNRMEEEQLKHCLALEKQQFEQLCFLERQEKREESLAKRELRTFSIVENSAGFICKELIDANGKTIGLNPICHSRNLRARKFFCDRYYDFPELLQVTWEGCISPLLFVLDDLDSSKAISVLQRNGCRFCGLRSDKTEICEQILAFLIRNASVKELPFAYGWNLLGNKWQWVSDEDMTMEEAMRNAL